MSHETATSARLPNLDSLIEMVETRSTSSGDFRRAVGELSTDLTYIRAALCDDPEKWRMNRAFHIVHVPSFLATMTLLDEVDQLKSVSKEDRHQILASVHRASLLAQEARNRIEQVILADAKVELGVLSDYAPMPSQPYTEPSFVSRTVDNASSLSESVWDVAKSGASQVPGLVGALQGGLSSTFYRAGSLPKLAASFQKSLAGTLSDTVPKPISMRLNVSGQDLKYG